MFTLNLRRSSHHPFRFRRICSIHKTNRFYAAPESKPRFWMFHGSSGNIFPKFINFFAIHFQFNIYFILFPVSQLHQLHHGSIKSILFPLNVSWYSWGWFSEYSSTIPILICWSFGWALFCRSFFHCLFGIWHQYTDGAWTRRKLWWCC